MGFLKMKPIPKGDKVLIVHDFDKGILADGISEGTIVDKEYLKVLTKSGKTELYYLPFIFPYDDNVKTAIINYATKRCNLIDALDKERFQLINTIKRGELK